MKASRRVWVFTCAALLAAAFIVFAWRAWPELLLFGGIVAVAAWGFGRQTRVKSRAKAVDAMVVEEAPAAERERIV